MNKSSSWVAWCVVWLLASSCSSGGRDYSNGAGGAVAVGGGSASGGASAGRTSSGGMESESLGGSSFEAAGDTGNASGGESVGAGGRVSGNGGEADADGGTVNATGGTTSGAGSSSGGTSALGGASNSGGAACVASNSRASSVCRNGDVWWLDDCQTPTLVKQDCCDQGCSGTQCYAPNAQATTQCYDGNEYWVDSCGVRGNEKKDCCGVGCSNNQCNAVDPKASKTCSAGDAYWVDSCGTLGQLAESCKGNGCDAGTCLAACPSEMVPIGNAHYCVDRYEASVWTTAACSGTQYFLSSKNFPDGFPPLVSSTGLSGNVVVANTSYSLVPPTATLYACSKSGVIPAQYITYFQAKRACENSGKRLCTLAEQQQACGTGYPYGPTYNGNACNGADAGKGAVVAAGSMSTCQGSVTGLFDMSGNVTEWAQCDANCSRAGGSFEGVAIDLACATTTGTYASSALIGEGFRCCEDR